MGSSMGGNNMSSNMGGITTQINNNSCIPMSATMGGSRKSLAKKSS